MSDYLTTDTELTSIANAIRTKGGTSASLVYPTGFVSAIEAIPQGANLPVFTVTIDVYDTVLSITCDKTYAQCAQLLDNEETLAAVVRIHPNYPSDDVFYGVYNGYTDYDGGYYALYGPYFYSGGLYDIKYWANGNIELVPSGWSGEEGIPVATKGTVNNHSITVTPSVVNTGGFIDGNTTITGNAVTVSASELVSGSQTISTNGTVDVTNLAEVVVSVSGGGAGVVVTETPDTGGGVVKNITAIDLSNDTVDAAHLLSGYIAHNNVGEAIIGNYTPSGTDTSDATLTSGNQMLSGYTAYAKGTKYTGTIPTKSSSDLEASGATVTVPSGYYASQVTKSVATGTVTAPSSISGTSATLSTGTNTLTLTKTVSVTPSVTTAGYVSSGTAGNASVSLTASVTTQAAQTIYPSTSDQSIAASRYLTGAQTIKAVTTKNLTADNIKNGVTVEIGDSTDSDRIASITGTYSGGGGTDRLVKLGTKSLGTISTSSTSSTDTGQTLDITGFDAYDILVCICYTPTHTNGRHVATIRLINFSATSAINTKTAVSIATSTQHWKLSSSGTLTMRSGTTPYGVYVNGGTISTSGTRTLTLTIYQRYNSTSTGTINGSYVLDVYGMNIEDLF